MTLLSDTFFNTLTELSNQFANPQKRVYLGYLLSALVIAIVWSTLYKKQPFTHSVRSIFSRKIWFSTSAKQDYILLLGNIIILLLLSPYLLEQITVANYLFERLHILAIPETLELPTWLITILFTLTLFLLDDITRYGLHRLLHRSAILWQFHKLHHSATVLTPLTIFRTHPIEILLFSLRGALVTGITVGSFVFFFGNQVNLLSILGANIFVFGFNILGANLRHSHIAIRYPAAIEHWLISPAQHQIHHSTDKAHYDQNFGVVLAIWDRLFGSLTISNDSTLTYGLKNPSTKATNKDKNKPVAQSIQQCYLSPFLAAYKVVYSKIWHSQKQHTRNNENQKGTQ